MAGICFHWERGIDLNLWNDAALAAGDIDTLALIGRAPDTIRSPSDAVGLCLYANLNQFLDDHRCRSMVYLCAPGEPASVRTPLWRFDHDTDWYMFGPPAGWSWEIDTAITAPQSGEMALPAAYIAATVMLHRHWVMRGRNG